MPFQKYNVADNAFSTLLVGISAGALSLQIQAGNGVRFPANNFPATLVKYTVSGDETSPVVSREKVLVTNNATDTFTITRGFDGDTPASFAAGDFIYLNVISKIVEDIQDEVSRLEADKIDIVDAVALTGNQTVDWIKKFLDYPEIDVYVAPTANEQFAPKKYVDDITAIVGEIKIWPTGTAPTNYLICDGASLLRTGTYAALFAVIGTSYGAVDGTHFNIPNIKGKVVVGFNSSETEFDALGETGGEKTHLLTSAESGLPAHSHSLSTAFGSTTTAGGILYPSGLAWGSFYQVVSASATTAANASTAHNNLQPYIVLNYIIRF